MVAAMLPVPGCPTLLFLSDTQGMLMIGLSAVVALVTAFEGFYWQDGYSAFTVGRSQIERVPHYIATQAEHHRRKRSRTNIARS